MHMEQNVAIISSEESFLNNYGAALQGVALYSTITELGYRTAIIKYKGGYFTNNPNLYPLCYIKKKMGEFYRSYLRNISSLEVKKKYKHKIGTREKLFEEFVAENLRFSSSKRLTWPQLKKKYPKADIYVCGSDQIWNPYFKGGLNDPGYFLAFAPKNTKKIAYAPSFGCDDLPEKSKSNLFDLLDDFSAISVREKSGVDIVKRYANRDAKWVLDPTLLRTPEQWKKLARMPRNIPEKYILCYRFAESEATRKAIDETSARLGLPVISIPLSDVALQDPYKFVFEAGPSEFIGLIQNATLVCTDSFHATVFSILLKTPVCVFLRESYIGGNSMNSRIYSLLEMLHLECLMKSEKDSNEKVITCLDIDYTEAHALLKTYRTESMGFLESALKG